MDAKSQDQGHLDKSTLIKILRNEISVSKDPSLLDHFEGCIHCQENLQVLREGRDSSTEISAFHQTALRKTPISSQTDGNTVVQQQPVDPSQRFIVGEKIAEGGMGVVYRGVDLELDRDVAIKIVAPHCGSDFEFDSTAVRIRFEREARISGQLQHPGIIPIWARLCVKHFPDQSMGHFNRHILSRKLGLLEESLEAVLKVSEVAPDYRYINAFVAQAYVEVGQFKEALPYARKSTEKYPHSEDFQARLASIYNKLGQPEKSVEIYEALIQQHPNRSHEFGLCEYLMDAEEMEKAESILNRLKETEGESKPDRITILTMRLLGLKGDMESAAKIGAQFVKDYPDSPFIKGFSKDLKDRISKIQSDEKIRR